jgi:hypothetical protein
MTCPVGRQSLPPDCAVIERGHTRVIVQGRVYAIIAPDEAHYSPFSTYFTVSLYPSKGKVKYLKFLSKEGRDRWGFEREGNYVVHGCLHLAGTKSLNTELVFDVTNVQRTE